MLFIQAISWHYNYSNFKFPFKLLEEVGKLQKSEPEERFKWN